jgi:hypothetical protein
MTPQASASLALAEWQNLRAAGLTPEQRIEELMRSFFLPPIDLDVRYSDTLQAVAEEMSVAPEVWVDCDECDGEGAIEKWESVSKWSIDPPYALVLPCQACNGAGGMICEAEGDRCLTS